MPQYMGTIAELGIALADLVEDQRDWSIATFGPDTERGPIGPLKHLAKEAVEAQRAYESLRIMGETQPVSDKFKEELADCLILILDASRRGGIKIMQLIEAAREKMKINKTRSWPKGITDEPVEHIRDD